jgi:GNAT superfamily N-acetyltransferase
VYGEEGSNGKDERERVETSLGNDIGIDEFGSFQQTPEELLKFARWFMDMVVAKKLERVSVTTLDLSVAQVLMSHGARVWDVFRSRWLSISSSSLSSASPWLEPGSLTPSASPPPPASLPYHHGKECYKIIEVNGQDWWHHFGRYHYMEHQCDVGGGSSDGGGFNNAARTYLLVNEDNSAIGLCATLSGMGIYQLGVVREHRTVILPQYQGMGIGQALVKVIAERYMRCGIGFFSRTKHPALVAARSSDAKWKTIETTAGKRDADGNAAYSHFYVGDSATHSSLVSDITHTEKIHEVEKALNLLQKILVGFSSKANSQKECLELLKKNHTDFFDLPYYRNCYCGENPSKMTKEPQRGEVSYEICAKCGIMMTNILDGAYVSRLFKPQTMWWKKGEKT